MIKLCLEAISYIFSLRSKVRVAPEGFWPIGIVYNTLGRCLSVGHLLSKDSR